MNITDIHEIKASAVPSVPKELSPTQRIVALECAQRLEDCTESTLSLAGGAYLRAQLNQISDEQFDDRIRAIVAEWAAGQSQWRPIETAPKDGTDFIGMRRDENRLLVLTTRYRKYAYSDVWENLEYDAVSPWSPSHWMPLPEPPR